MTRSWRGEIVQLAPVMAMLIAAAVCWPFAPDRMPVHWNLQGEADGYSGKAMGLLMLPASAFGMYLLTLFLPLVDPGRANYATFAKAYHAIRLSLSLFLAAMFTVMLLAAFGYHVNMNTVVGLGLGAMFIVLGNVMGKIRPNWFVGVRTPWTLSSKLSWTKTHRLAGWFFIAMGLMAIAWGLWQSTWMFAAMMTFDVGCVVVIVLYSYVVYRNDPARTTPAGTSPSAE